MNLFDDIDSFELKATKVLTQGLSPFCDHAGFDEGQFWCLGCSTPLFDKDDLWIEGHITYSFRRPLSLSLFEYSFDAVSFYPKTTVSCLCCGQTMGFIQFNSLRNEKIFCILSRSLFLHFPTQV